ncbi:MAG: hypothetical protein WD696_14045 [Bryobacteraceae bacterium]
MIRCLLLLLPVVCLAQDFTHRGFLETGSWFYPQTARGDSGRAIGESLLRYEAFYKAAPSLRFSAGFDARTDTHRQVERDVGFSFLDRNRRRPAFAVRRASASYHTGPLSIEIGKQFIRWGKTDILNPTDRFAPRDFLNVVDNDFLAVTAARLTYGSQSGTLDLVWAPLFTPSRTPLLNQRWVVLPPDVRIQELDPRLPGGPQFGARWSHIGRIEYSLSFYEGFNHLPLIDARAFEVQRFHPQMRMYGADAAVPLPQFTLKGEAAYFTSSTRQADHYLLYVVQLERQVGEWFFVGGYAGEKVTARRSQLDFAPDRGLTRAFLGRAAYTIDSSRSVAFDAAVRQNGHGVWTGFEYSQAFGSHWRATLGFTLIRGRRDDFLGQFRRNSHASFALRYSF